MSNKIIVVLFLIMVSPVIAQEYTFDTIVESTFSSKFSPDQKNTDIFNTEDYSYSMQIYQKNDSLIARIIDTDNLVRHYFHFPKNNFTESNYYKSDSLQFNKNNYKFSFSTPKGRLDEKKVVFKILDDKDKIVSKYKLKVILKDSDLFQIFKNSILETVTFNAIVPRINFLVLESRGYNTSGNFTSYKVDTINEIDLKLSVPEFQQ